MQRHGVTSALGSTRMSLLAHVSAITSTVVLLNSSVSHGVQYCFPRLWDTGMSNAILMS